MAAEVTGPKLKSAQHVTEQKWLEQVAKAAEKQVDLKVSLSLSVSYSEFSLSLSQAELHILNLILITCKVDGCLLSTVYCLLSSKFYPKFNCVTLISYLLKFI